MIDRKYRLLALDLDGTTLMTSNTLSPTVKNAIEMAIASGIIVIVASGRPYGTMPKEVMQIKGIDYAITSNGAGIYDKNGKCINKMRLDDNDVLKLLDITRPYDLIFEAFIDGLTYTDLRYVTDPVAFGCSEAYVDYVRSAHGHIPDMRKFIYDHRFELDSIEFIEHNEPLRTKLWKELEENTENFYITSSTPSFVEFMAKNATKANGLEWVCKHLGIDKSQTIACGNADNDADMIEWAGLGAAVQNATEACISAADIVVSSNNDDGVAELIDFLIKT